MYVIVLGAGEVGSYVAERLSRQGIDVAVIEHDAHRLRALAEELDVLTVHGSGTHPEVLAEAGAAKADLLVAVSNDDEVNMIASLVGKAGRDPPHPGAPRGRCSPGERPQPSSVRPSAPTWSSTPTRKRRATSSQLLELPGASEVEVLADGEVLIIGARLHEPARRWSASPSSRWRGSTNPTGSSSSGPSPATGTR